MPAEVQRHCDEISRADGIIIVHPNWWGQPPAILKGWVDRLLRPGVAYEFLEGDKGEGIPRGLLRANCAVVFNTSNTETLQKSASETPSKQSGKNAFRASAVFRKFTRKMLKENLSLSAEAERARWLAKLRRPLNGSFRRDNITSVAVTKLPKRSFPRNRRDRRRASRWGAMGASGLDEIPMTMPSCLKAWLPLELRPNGGRGSRRPVRRSLGGRRSRGQTRMFSLHLTAATS